jgi:hypothetical protein
MRKKPKPNWNETVPPIINKHHKKIEALGVSLLEFVVWPQGGLIAASELNRENIHRRAMSGLPDFNRAAFNHAHFHLWSKGHIVLNPARLPDGLTQAEYMDICLSMLRCADAIYMLEGWEHRWCPSGECAGREAENGNYLPGRGARRMNRASPVDLRKASKSPTTWRTSGFALCRSRWRPKKNSRRWPPSYRDGLSRWLSKPRRMKAVQHEGTNHQVAKAAFFIAGVHLQPN